MKVLYIIGNGFDLNIGLKTSYVDFYNYYNSLTTTKDKVKFLKEAIRNDYQTWADLELGLGQYTSNTKTAEDFIEIFEDITDQLATYLEQEENAFDFSLIDVTKFNADLCTPEKYLPPADRIILTDYKKNWKSNHWTIGIITLNYTRSLEKIVKFDNAKIQIGTSAYSYQINLSGIDHLHGYINNRMIMGVNDLTQIKNEDFRNTQEIIEAFVKPICNSASKETVDTKCAKLIESADLICIFGCSIGDTDKTWWELIGMQLKKGIKLIIFTRGDEISKRRPYKNLTIERKIKKLFIEKTKLSNQEIDSISNNIFVAYNTEMFSHMRTQ